MGCASILVIRGPLNTMENLQIQRANTNLENDMKRKKGHIGMGMEILAQEISRLARQLVYLTSFRALSRHSVRLGLQYCIMSFRERENSNWFSPPASVLLFDHRFSIV